VARETLYLLMHRKIFLTAFLAAPILVVALLCFIIADSLTNKNIHKLPPVGAGAGDTGGANALGEAFKARLEAVPVVAKVNGHAEAVDDANLVDPTTLEQGFLIVVEDKAKLANASKPIYIAGNFNGWNPADPDYKLTPQSDMRWRIQLKKPVSKINANEPIKFKFTRGGWDYEELRDDMSVPTDRTLPKVDMSKVKPGELPQIEMSVAKWGDMRPEYAQKKSADPYRAIKVTGTVKRLQVRGGAGAAASGVRDLLVWLPEGYDKNTTTRYPVLYLHDGQNIFDFSAPTPGEWKADEIATQLIAAGKVQPMIIVGIPHSGATRTLEYMPPLGADGKGTHKLLEGKPSQGKVHVDWLLSEVMPRVNAAFRTSTKREDTAIGGSSMGGLISLYAAAYKPEVFGKVLAESPAVHMAGVNLWEGAAFSNTTRWPDKIFMAVGTKEGFDSERLSSTFVEGVKKFDGWLTSKGMSESSKVFVLEEGAVHNEDAWAKRFPQALEFLCPAKK